MMSQTVHMTVINHEIENIGLHIEEMCVNAGTISSKLYMFFGLFIKEKQMHQNTARLLKISHDTTHSIVQ